MQKTLFENGFRYDEEDNLWYDENPNRKRYFLRAGVSDDRKKCELFAGGYGNKIETFNNKDTLIEYFKTIKPTK